MFELQEKSRLDRYEKIEKFAIKTFHLKVALSQKILENFYIFNINIPNRYPEQNIWIFPPKTVNNLFKFSAQDTDLKYLCWRHKIFPVSSELKPPLDKADFYLNFTKRIVKDRFIHHLPKFQTLNSKDFIPLFPFKNYMAHISFYAKSKANELPEFLNFLELLELYNSSDLLDLLVLPENFWTSLNFWNLTILHTSLIFWNFRNSWTSLNFWNVTIPHTSLTF